MKAETTLFKIRHETNIGDETRDFLNSRNFDWEQVRSGVASFFLWPPLT